MKPRSKNRFDVEIDDDQVFLELFAACDEIAIFIEHETVSIKYQFVLSADKVVVNNDNHIIGSARCQHPLAPAPFPGVIGRRGYVDDDLGASGQRLKEYRPVGIPDVLADAHADCCAVYPENRTLSARLEIPEFVENAVIGQIHLVIGCDEFSILRDRRSIEDVIFPIDEADNCRDLFCPADDLFERREIGIDKLRLQ